VTDQRDGIVIFRIQLLPRSETFIATQAAAMRRFEPYFVGWRRVAGLELPENKSWTADDDGFWGRTKELRFRYFGCTDSEIARLKARSPRLVYAHFALDGYAAMRLAQQLGVPLVTALHGFDMTMSDEALGATRLGREYLKGRTRLQRQGALFVACSEYVRRRAIERGYPADRTIVHSIGVDVERFVPPSSERRKPIVLFVGRLVEKKGCDRLIEAMVEVQRRCADAELVVIGNGVLRADCEALAAARRVRCLFLGSQPTAVVQEWMARAKVFCVPSVVATSGDAEGFGIVFIEAQAMGLPVVSTRSGGIPEAVEDGQTGLLVAEDDRQALAEAIIRLMQDEGLWQHFSLAGRRRVVERFNLAQQTQRLEELFDDVLSSRRMLIGHDNLVPSAIGVSIETMHGNPPPGAQDLFPYESPMKRSNANAAKGA
jgi:colanic acid/amylovoran biosynthesis glycosyltransferase